MLLLISLILELRISDIRLMFQLRDLLIRLVDAVFPMMTEMPCGGLCDNLCFVRRLNRRVFLFDLMDFAVNAGSEGVKMCIRDSRDTGWYLRNDIIWMKDNPMPESVKDRCARCYEHIFLFSKSKKYFFDYKAISEPIAPATAERLKRGMKGGNKYGKPVPGQPQPQSLNRPREHGEIKDCDINPLRNKRDVWKINTVPFKGGHYAAYPPKLVETCLLAGCPEGGIVLDPFMGSGTTGMVASQMGRHFVGIELNPAYTELAYKRIGGEI